MRDSGGYEDLMRLLILGVCAIPIIYVFVRVGAYAWFHTKLNYQRKLIDGLTTGTGETDGKPAEE